MPDNSPETVMKKGSRSFHLASRLLPPQVRQKISILYSFCRFVDDVADSYSDRELALSMLHSISASIAEGDSQIPQVASLLVMVDAGELEVTYLQDLMEGLVDDVTAVRVATDRELIRYCYRVAGTVGAMCSRIIGANDPAALPFAIDLGIAMQLTNIARDVAEDFHIDRVYLPASRVNYETVRSAVKGDSKASREELFEAVSGLLRLARTYYRSADEGMRFIPLSTRWGVLCASKCYEEIGEKILLTGPSYLDARVVTGAAVKSQAVVNSLAQIVSRYCGGSGQSLAHDYCLHSSFREKFPAV
jgi:15-cis-phytoene synthase